MAGTTASCLAVNKVVAATELLLAPLTRCRCGFVFGRAEQGPGGTEVIWRFLFVLVRNLFIRREVVEAVLGLHYPRFLDDTRWRPC